MVRFFGRSWFSHVAVVIHTPGAHRQHKKIALSGTKGSHNVCTRPSNPNSWLGRSGWNTVPSHPVPGGGPGWLSAAPDVDIFVLESNMPCLSLVPIDQWMQDYMPNTHCLQGSWVSGSGGSPMITWRKMWGPGMPISAIPVWVTR